MVFDLFALLAIVLLGMAVVGAILAGYSRRLTFNQRKLEIEQGHAGGDRSAAANELVARLEKRVRVLERLATERGPDVAAQIEALREDRALADLSTPGANTK